MFEIRTGSTGQLELYDGNTVVTDEYGINREHLPYMTCFQHGVSYCDPSPRYEFEVEEQLDPPKKIWNVYTVGDSLGTEATDSGNRWDVDEPTNNRWGTDNRYTEHWIKTYTNPHDFPVFIRFKQNNWDDAPEWGESDNPPTYEEMYYIKLKRQGYFLLSPGESMTIDGIGQGINDVYVYAANPYELKEPFRKYKSKLVDGTPIESVGMGVVHPEHRTADFDFGSPFRNYFDLIELPLLWRTVGVKDIPIYDIDGMLGRSTTPIPHGEYYFLDPFAPFPPILHWGKDREVQGGHLDRHKRNAPLTPNENRNTPIRMDCDKVAQLQAWYRQNADETCSMNRCWLIPSHKLRDFYRGKKTMERVFAEMKNADIPSLDAWEAYNGHSNFPNRTAFEPSEFPIDKSVFWGDLMYSSYCEALQAHFGRTFSNTEQTVRFGQIPIHWLKVKYNEPYTILKTGTKWNSETQKNEPELRRYMGAACMSAVDDQHSTGDKTTNFYILMPASNYYYMQKKAAFAMLGVEPREEQFTFQWSAPFGGKGQASLSEALAHGWSASLSHSIYNDHHSSAELHCWIPNPRYEKTKSQPDTQNLERTYEFINDFPLFCIALSDVGEIKDDIEFNPLWVTSLPLCCNDLEAPVHYSMAKDWKPQMDSFGCYSGLSLTGQPLPYNGYFPAFNGNGAAAAYGNVRAYWEKVNGATSKWTWNNGDFIRACGSPGKVSSPQPVTGANGCIITAYGGIFDIENLRVYES